jgi:uncharacterized protein YjbI with pentapeptide repeats
MKRRERKESAVVGRFRSWWQAIKQHPFIATTIIVALFAFIIFIFAVYTFGWGWTGFNGGYGQVTTHTPAKDTVLPPAKTLWDWLQLLIIPFVLAIGGFLLNRLQKDREEKAIVKREKDERKAAKKRASVEREAALDNQREVALREYIDKLSELLLKERLRDSQEGDEVRSVARARTIAILRQLDKNRKVIVLQFLHQAKLIAADTLIIPLDDADLREVDLGVMSFVKAAMNKTRLNRANFQNAFLIGIHLRWADLTGANLSRANISQANLEKAILYQANLSEAYLYKTNLSGADLREAELDHADLGRATLREAKLDGADLQEAKLEGATGISVEELEKKAKSLKGAIMPDGSIHS